MAGADSSLARDYAGRDHCNLSIIRIGEEGRIEGRGEDRGKEEREVEDEEKEEGRIWGGGRYVEGGREVDDEERVEGRIRGVERIRGVGR